MNKHSIHLPPLEVPALDQILWRMNPHTSSSSLSRVPFFNLKPAFANATNHIKRGLINEVTSNASRHLCERTGHLKCARSLLSPVRLDTVTKYLVSVSSRAQLQTLHRFLSLVPLMQSPVGPGPIGVCACVACGVLPAHGHQQTV